MRTRHAIPAAFLLGVGASWNAGNVGPAVDELAADFGVSLAAIGLLSGTVFFAAVIAAVLSADALVRRAGFPWALRLTCLLAGLGNVVFALSPGFLGLAAGRVVCGLGTGLAFVLAPVFARELGGVRLVGAVGAAMQLGVAAALGDPDLWRLTALFVATLTVPLILGAWLVHYLVAEGIDAATAGALSFVLFGFSASMRLAGARLSAGGVPASVVGGIAPLLAAAGLALLALEPSELPVVLVASFLTGAGFALPFALLMIEAQWILPADPVAPLALMTLVNNAIPIVAIPAVGAAFAAGNGEAALLVLAGVVAFGALANLRPPKRQIGPAPEDAPHPGVHL